MSTSKKKTPPARRPKKEIVLNISPPSDLGPTTKYLQDRYEKLSLRAMVENGAADYILDRPNHPYFMRMLEFVTERAHGKVAVELRQKIEAMPAVALPAKDPEQIPDAQFEVLPESAAMVAAALLPPKADGTPDYLAAPAGAADDLPPGE